MKLEKYNNGGIGKAARRSLFLASPAMLMALGCEKVGHELCQDCGESLEIWKTAKSRYMPLSRLPGELYNTGELIMYKLHWHQMPKKDRTNTQGTNTHSKLAALSTSHESNLAHAENSSGGEPEGKPGL